MCDSESIREYLLLPISFAAFKKKVQFQKFRSKKGALIFETNLLWHSDLQPSHAPWSPGSF